MKARPPFPISTASPFSAPASPPPVDRWWELELSFFDPHGSGGLLAETAQRLAPIYAQAEGLRGLVINCGWVMDLVTIWTGDIEQRLPFHGSRLRAWRNSSYRDLRDFLVSVREAFAAAGVADLKIGPMFIGWGHFDWGDGLYDTGSGWFNRHPELFGLGDPSVIGNTIDYRKRLRADAHAYAVRPNGIAEGESFADFFAGQWASVAEALDFDAVMLRDAFLGPAIYERQGPYGQWGPPSYENSQEWSTALIAFFVAIKQSRPEAIVMGYSSARSPIGELRVGCFDLEALAASGGIDIWVDQTWGGAWEDWWSQPLRGWTAQLVNLLVHLAMIERARRLYGSRCRIYHLVEALDSWEPWDTLHGFPHKLAWAIHAFRHAAALGPGGRRTHTDGAYLAWPHDRAGVLVSEMDVEFLRRQLASADESAATLEHVAGPALTYDRAALERLRRESPAKGQGEWIDDQCAMLMKWAQPLLTIADAELVAREPATTPWGSVRQLGGGEAATTAEQPAPRLAIGNARQLPTAVLERVGCVLADTTSEPGYQKAEMPPAARAVHPISVLHMDSHSGLNCTTGQVVMRASGVPVLVVSPDGRDLLWQPPDVRSPGESYLRSAQFGSLGQFAAVADAFQMAREQADHPTVTLSSLAEPATFHFWRSAGRWFFLLGNLESNLLGDSRLPRLVKLRLPLRLVAAESEGSGWRLRDCETQDFFACESAAPAHLISTIHIEPQGMRVLILEQVG